jgi:hypothetical protein
VSSADREIAWNDDASRWKLVVAALGPPGARRATHRWDDAQIKVT